MRTELYLDTVRFGRMTPRARVALDDFARLCAVEGGSLRLLEIVRGGAADGAGIRDWSGIDGLRGSVRVLLNAPAEAPVLLAQRSAPLARVLARAIFHRCERVLCTDLDWPRYRTLLAQEALRAGRELVCVPVRDAVLRGGASLVDLVRTLAGGYRSNDCDGLFMSDVTFEGVRLPVAGLMRELGTARSPRFVAVDGAQAPGHVACDLGTLACDAYLAGCHKWLAAGQTLGFAVCPRPRSRALIESVLREMILAGAIDDPLLLLVCELDGTLPGPPGDTADLACLFSGAAALAAARTPGWSTGEDRCRVASDNAERLRWAARSSGWRPFTIDHGLETGIVLLGPAGDATGQTSPEDVRRLFQERGVALTVFPGAVLRVSLPEWPLTERRLAPLKSALGDLAMCLV